MPIPDEFVVARTEVRFPDGEPEIVIAQEVLDAMAGLWKNYMFVKVLDRSMPLPLLDRKLREIWRPNGGMNVVDLPRRFFMVRFDLESNYLDALTWGPWKVFQNHIFVQAWDPFFDHLKDDIVTTPLTARGGKGVVMGNPKLLLEDGRSEDNKRPQEVAVSKVSMMESESSSLGHVIPGDARVTVSQASPPPLAQSAANLPCGPPHVREHSAGIPINNQFSSLAEDSEDQEMAVGSDLGSKNKEGNYSVILRKGKEKVGTESSKVNEADTSSGRGPKNGGAIFSAEGSKALKMKQNNENRPTRGLVFRPRGKSGEEINLGKRQMRDETAKISPNLKLNPNVGNTVVLGNAENRPNMKTAPSPLRSNMVNVERTKVDVQGQSGGVWLLWRQCSTVVKIANSSNQFIHATVDFGEGIVNLIAMYAAPSPTRRHDLWGELEVLISGSHVY
ncbi:hypothetical protein V2J09_015937 [Rumex salicifolius]